MKKLSELTESEVVICNNAEERDAILKLMHEEGLEWAGGMSYAEFKPDVMTWNFFPIYLNPKKGTWDRYIDDKTVHPASNWLQAKKPDYDPSLLINIIDTEGHPNILAVDHPVYYNVGRIEVIDFIEDQGMDFTEGCIIKYICRYKKKNGLQDLEKAQWYLNRLIERKKNETNK